MMTLDHSRVAASTGSVCLSICGLVLFGLGILVPSPWDALLAASSAVPILIGLWLGKGYGVRAWTLEPHFRVLGLRRRTSILLALLYLFAWTSLTVLAQKASSKP